jgi:hypothetical protein
MYSRGNELFGKIYKLSLDKCEQWKNSTGLGFATGQSNNLAQWQPIRSNNYQNNYQWQQMLNGQHISVSINRASMIFGSVSTVIEW